MGRVANDTPVQLSELVTGYSQTYPKSLRNFIAGGAIANTNTAAFSGWIPTSGTINLLAYRDATNLNVTFAGSNTGFTAEGSDVEYSGNPASATVTVTVQNDGILFIDPTPRISATAGGVNVPINSQVNNSWLHRQGGVCSTQTTGLFEVLFLKTGGTVSTTGMIFSNNTWLALSTSRSIILSASASTTEFSQFNSQTRAFKGRIKFRRADTLTELANVYVDLLCTATSNWGAPP